MLMQSDSPTQSVPSTASTPSRVVRTASQWQALFQEQSKSGLSVKAFCTSCGIHPSGFYAWRRKLTASPKSPVPREKFIKLTAKPSKSLATITLPNGIAVSLPVESLEDLLPHLVEVK